MTQTTREAVERLARKVEGTPLYEGCGEESDLPEYAAATLRALLAEKEAAEARVAELEAVVIGTASSLAAAISLLERGGKAAKKAAPSDKMFDQMLTDYRNALRQARAALAQKGE